MRSSINVTPLVDVCLVLLIIFMVVTDKLGPGKEVPLPRTANHVNLTAARPRVVSLTRDGAAVRLWWGQEPLSGPADLAARLAAEPRPTGEPVLVKADAGLSYGDVYPVLAALHRSGATGAGLATREL